MWFVFQCVCFSFLCEYLGCVYAHLLYLHAWVFISVCVYSHILKKKVWEGLCFIVACVTASSRLELSWPVIRISHLETSAPVTHTFCLNIAAQPPPMILHSSQHPAPIPHGSYRWTHNLQLVRVSVCSRHPAHCHAFVSLIGPADGSLKSLHPRLLHDKFTSPPSLTFPVYLNITAGTSKSFTAHFIHCFSQSVTAGKFSGFFPVLNCGWPSR